MPVMSWMLKTKARQLPQTYRHFAPMAGRDARGDKVACADADHDRQGRAL